MLQMEKLRFQKTKSLTQGQQMVNESQNQVVWKPGISLHRGCTEPVPRVWGSGPWVLDPVIFQALAEALTFALPVKQEEEVQTSYPGWAVTGTGLGGR